MSIGGYKQRKAQVQERRKKNPGFVENNSAYLADLEQCLPTYLETTLTERHSNYSLKFSKQPTLTIFI